MIEYHRSIICDDPKLYLAYILFAEYLIVLGAGEWLALLETRCGIPASSLSAVGNHVELDKDHVTQEMAVLNELVHPEDTRALGEVIDRSADLWDTFSAELCAHEPPLATAHPI
jgi:hypothetical protein